MSKGKQRKEPYVSWGMAIIVGLGVAIIFGAYPLVAELQGETQSAAEEATGIGRFLFQVVNWFTGPIGGGIATLAVIVVGIGAMVTLRPVKENKDKERVRKIKIKYAGLSVVGVFLNRFDKSYTVAAAIISATLVIYMVLAQITPVRVRVETVYLLLAYFGILVTQRSILKYRIRRGYYLNNESEARELIDFIRSNSDDIDFTGTNLKIVSKRDLEDVVLGEMGRIPAT